MVIHYPPERLRSNSDQPTAITNVLITASGSSHTGEIPLGTPTCSARTRRGRWALYPSGEEGVGVLARSARRRCRGVVVDSGTDLVQPGGRLLAQRPHQPGRPPHPPVSQPAG